MKNEWHIIGKGLAGWHAQGINVSVTSYSTREEEMNSLVADAVPHALVYDGSKADVGAFCKLVVSGPIPDPKLGKFEHKPLSIEAKVAMSNMLPGLGGGFKTIAIASLAEGQRKYGSLDIVGVGIYEALLKLVPGMKIGHVEGGRVVWD